MTVNECDNTQTKSVLQSLSHKEPHNFCAEPEHDTAPPLMAPDPSPEATSLDWKSQCLENPSVPLLRLADKKSRIYRV
jgi:hypothetical protein